MSRVLVFGVLVFRVLGPEFLVQSCGPECWFRVLVLSFCVQILCFRVLGVQSFGSEFWSSAVGSEFCFSEFWFKV